MISDFTASRDVEKESHESHARRYMPGFRLSLHALWSLYFQVRRDAWIQNEACGGWDKAESCWFKNGVCDKFDQRIAGDCLLKRFVLLLPKLLGPQFGTGEMATVKNAADCEELSFRLSWLFNGWLWQNRMFIGQSNHAINRSELTAAQKLEPIVAANSPIPRRFVIRRRIFHPDQKDFVFLFFQVPATNLRKWY